MDMSPTQAKKVAAGLGVVTLICAIVSNASTSGILLSVTQQGVTAYEEVGIWRTTTGVSGGGEDISETSNTQCYPSGGCNGNACCTSLADRCITLQTFAIFGV
jgi:hypothetical protein